jgi:hypothetical protein
MQLIGLRNSEIGDLIDSVVEEDVGGFEVPVDDVELAEVDEPLAYLEEHVDEFVELAIGLAIPGILILLLTALLEVVAQIAAVAVLGDNVEEVVGLHRGGVTLSVASYLTILGWTNGFRI